MQINFKFILFLKYKKMKYDYYYFFVVIFSYKNQMWFTAHDTALCSYNVHVCMYKYSYAVNSNTCTHFSLMLDSLAKICVQCAFQSNHVKILIHQVWLILMESHDLNKFPEINKLPYSFQNSWVMVLSLFLYDLLSCLYIFL